MVTCVGALLDQQQEHFLSARYLHFTLRQIKTSQHTVSIVTVHVLHKHTEERHLNTAPRGPSQM